MPNSNGNILTIPVICAASVLVFMPIKTNIGIFIWKLLCSCLNTDMATDAHKWKLVLHADFENTYFVRLCNTWMLQEARNAALRVFFSSLICFLPGHKWYYPAFSLFFFHPIICICRCSSWAVWQQSSNWQKYLFPLTLTVLKWDIQFKLALEVLM